MTLALNSQIDTKLFRYPELFGYAFYLQKLGFLPSNPRILSFGCSTGEELLSLRHYFPTARLFGCDVVEEALQQARQVTTGDTLTTVFHSNIDAIRSHGPYDLIMSNSVMCDNTDNPNRLRIVFPFSRFEDLLCDVAQQLAPDGVICVFNPSYLPDESDTFLQVASPVRSHFATLGYVPKFARTGQLLVDRLVVDGKGYYRVADNADPALLGLIQNTFYTRSEALRQHRIDYSGLPHERSQIRHYPADPKLVTERAKIHLSDSMVNSSWAWPQHSNLDIFIKDFLPEVLIQVPGVTDGFVSLA